MIATVTLASTTFAQPVAPGDTLVYVVSTSGIAPGVRLYCDQELLTVVRITGLPNEVAVIRGQDGTYTRRHNTAVPVYIGRGDQFYESDPVGTPPLVIPVFPHINVRNGTLWGIEGDDVTLAYRLWVPITTAELTGGALGVRTVTTVTPN